MMYELEEINKCKRFQRLPVLFKQIKKIIPGSHKANFSMSYTPRDKGFLLVTLKILPLSSSCYSPASRLIVFNLLI